MENSENKELNGQEPILIIEKIGSGTFKATTESNGIKRQVFLSVISEEQVNFLDSIKKGIEEKSVATM